MTHRLKLNRAGCSPTLIAITACVLVAVGIIVYVVKDGDKHASSHDISSAGVKGGGKIGPGGSMEGGVIAKGGPPHGAEKDTPPLGGGMMGGMAGGEGGMMGKDRPGQAAGPGGMPEVALIDQNRLIPFKELKPEVRKRIEESTVYIEIKHKEKDPHIFASGSGFLAFEPGIVLTSAHVVDMLEPGSDEPESITVVIHSGQANQKELKGKVLAVDQKADLAVVRVDPAGLPPPLVVKSSSSLVATQPVFVCGFPRGKDISNSVTIFQGQVASLSRDPKTKVLDRLVLISEMQHGNSGGPVVNDTVEVVGVVAGDDEGTRIHMTVPGDYVHTIINGRITRMRTGQSSFSGGQVTVPVVAELINPMGRLGLPAPDL